MTHHKTTRRQDNKTTRPHRRTTNKPFGCNKAPRVHNRQTSLHNSGNATNAFISFLFATIAVAVTVTVTTIVSIITITTIRIRKSPHQQRIDERHDEQSATDSK
uniref:Uncharacterized protein n=1 Tax=Craspedostauros australis TaxID=1486917 RepID=A0A7S0F5J7_9STRA